MVEGPRAWQARNNAMPGCWNSMQAVYSEVGWVSRGKNGQSEKQHSTPISKTNKNNKNHHFFFKKNGNTTHRKLLDKKQYMLGENVPSKNIYLKKNSTVKVAKLPGTTTAIDLYVDMNKQMIDDNLKTELAKTIVNFYFLKLKMQEQGESKLTTKESLGY